MTHTWGLRSDLFDRALDGRKTVEVRLKDAKRKDLAVGDALVLLREPDRIDSMAARVTGVTEYANFGSLLAKESIQDTGFSTEHDLLAALRSFYTRDEEAASRVLVVRFERA